MQDKSRLSMLLVIVGMASVLASLAVSSAIESGAAIRNPTMITVTLLAGILLDGIGVGLYSYATAPAGIPIWAPILRLALTCLCASWLILVLPMMAQARTLMQPASLSFTVAGCVAPLAILWVPPRFDAKWKARGGAAVALIVLSLTGVLVMGSK